MQLIEFAANHWPLVASFILLAVLLAVYELKSRHASAKPLTPQETTQLINQGNAILVDLRDAKLFEQGHILSSLLISSKDLATHPKITAARNTPIILLCQTGFIAPASGTQLRKLGYTQVFYLKGGIQEWQTSGLPLSKRKS